ncbi:hypothetical protein [Caldithrix abyssi]
MLNIHLVSSTPKYVLYKNLLSSTFGTAPGVNSADLLGFPLKIICLIISCDDWRNLRENYFARVAVDFACGCAVLAVF